MVNKDLEIVFNDFYFRYFLDILINFFAFLSKIQPSC
jgi:hypothetical protein